MTKRGFKSGDYHVTLICRFHIIIKNKYVGLLYLHPCHILNSPKKPIIVRSLNSLNFISDFFSS